MQEIQGSVYIYMYICTNPRRLHLEFFDVIFVIIVLNAPLPGSGYKRYLLGIQLFA